MEPKELRVASGGKLRFRITLNNPEAKGVWTASLDDHCGQALKPVLFDDKDAPVEHPSMWYAPLCPSRVAEVMLSRRGRVTTLIDLVAMKRTRERVVVGHETKPNGKVENIEEERIKETPLPAGRYTIELALPTPDAPSTTVPLEVVGVAPP